MKIAATIAGALLGLMFVAFGLLFFFIDPSKFPQPDPGSMQDHFMRSFGVSGWLTFVKICEIAGGLLVAIPKTRNFGLLVLGPIIINIAASHAFIQQGDGLFSPILIVIVLLAGFLLWCERRKFAGLLH